MDKPDWSFQDIAIENIMKDFRTAPSLVSGLIVPTGGGKTNIALRLALKMIKENPNSKKKVVWVTHRNNLKTQARERLKKLLNSSPELSLESFKIIEERFMFVSNIDISKEKFNKNDILLGIVDEGHRAAARTYGNLFESDREFPILIITATPIRTDDKDLPIEKISFQISYKELFEKKVILLPDFIPFEVKDFDYKSGSVISEIVSYLLDNSPGKFKKTLVYCSSLDLVSKFYEEFIKRIEQRSDSALSKDDIFFLHSKGKHIPNIDNDTYLSLFAQKESAILISAQMLVEGFDDPTVDTIFLTYPSESLILKMQAAGRCVRYHPEKEKSYVIQVRNDSIAYYYDNRWLYQDISDKLRPVIRDIYFNSNENLIEEVGAICNQHNLSKRDKEYIINCIRNTDSSQYYLMLTGNPFYGNEGDFDTSSTWGGVIFDNSNKRDLVTLENKFSFDGNVIRDPSLLVQRLKLVEKLDEIPKNIKMPKYVELIEAMNRSLEEIYLTEKSEILHQNRDYCPGRGTTWLRYYVFTYQPEIDKELNDFLVDVVNHQEVRAKISSSEEYLLFKTPLYKSSFYCEVLDLDVFEQIKSIISTCEILETPDEEGKIQSILVESGIKVSIRTSLNINLILNEKLRKMLTYIRKRT